jgi:hypothetical protein
MEAISFIHEDQSGRVQDRPLFGLILPVCFKVRWIDCRAVARGIARRFMISLRLFSSLSLIFSKTRSASRWIGSSAILITLSRARLISFLTIALDRYMWGRNAVGIGMVQVALRWEALVAILFGQEVVRDSQPVEFREDLS